MSRVTTLAEGGLDDLPPGSPFALRVELNNQAPSDYNTPK